MEWKILFGSVSKPFRFSVYFYRKKHSKISTMNKFIFKLDNIYKQFIHNVNYLLYINHLYIYTGSRLLRGRLQWAPSYGKHFFSLKRSLLIDINVKKDQLVL